MHFAETSATELFVVRTYAGAGNFAGILAVINEGAGALFGGAGAVNRRSHVSNVGMLATADHSAAWRLQASKRISHDGQDDHDLGRR